MANEEDTSQSSGIPCERAHEMRRDMASLEL